MDLDRVENIREAKITNLDVVNKAAKICSPELEELFIHLGDIDIFGKKIIKKNTDLVKLDTPTQNTRKERLGADHNLVIESNLIVPDNIESEGRYLYKKYPELRDLSTMMEHPEFFNFYLKYMRNPASMKQMMVLMKMYHLISQYMYEKDPAEANHNSYHKLVFLYKLIANPVYSRLLIKKIQPKTENIAVGQ